MFACKPFIFMKYNRFWLLEWAFGTRCFSRSRIPWSTLNRSASSIEVATVNFDEPMKRSKIARNVKTDVPAVHAQR